MKTFIFILAAISIPIVISIFAIMAIYEKNSSPTDSDAISLAEKRLKVSLKNPTIKNVNVFKSPSTTQEAKYILSGHVCGEVAFEYSSDFYSSYSRFIVPVLITKMNDKQEKTFTIYLESQLEPNNFEFAWQMMCKNKS